jgi:hypothetical protein
MRRIEKVLHALDQVRREELEKASKEAPKG